MRGEMSALLRLLRSRLFDLTHAGAQALQHEPRRGHGTTPHHGIGEGRADPLLNGVTLTLPTSGDYTVVDPIGSDLMNNPPCELKLTVALTPMSR
jgi:hypothetical protein